MSAWFDLEDEKERGRALAYLAKGVLNPKRNSDQNRLFHAMLGEIARSVTWGGRKWDIDSWKRLITAAWMRTRQMPAVMAPAIDGHGFDVIYHHTSTLSKVDFAELVDFTTAWAVEQGVELAIAEQA